MNWDRIEGNWKQLKGKVQVKWGKLTDDQFDVIAGRREQLVGHVQEQYGIGKDEAEKQVEFFASRSRTRTSSRWRGAPVPDEVRTDGDETGRRAGPGVSGARRFLMSIALIEAEVVEATEAAHPQDQATASPGGAASRAALTRSWSLATEKGFRSTSIPESSTPALEMMSWA